MLAEVATILMALSLGVTFYGVFAAYWGIRRRTPAWAKSACNAVRGACEAACAASPACARIARQARQSPR